MSIERIDAAQVEHLAERSNLLAMFALVQIVEHFDGAQVEPIRKARRRPAGALSQPYPLPPYRVGA